MPAVEPPFEELSTRAQVHRIRQVALRALERFPIEPQRVRLMMHGFNTSFRVDTSDGRRFALRVGVNRMKPLAALVGEVEWLAALAAEGRVEVPGPLAANDGRHYTTEWCSSLERDLHVVLMSWLPGRDLERRSVEGIRALGAAMAHLHEHGERFVVPPDAELPRIDRLMMDSEDFLAGGHPLIGPSEQATIDEARRAVEPHFRALRRGRRRHPLHADLHPDNVKWYRGRLAVFDFDDAGIGHPIQDLAISAYYLRNDAELENALLAGYESVRPVPAGSHERFEALVAARNIILLNDVVSTTTADIREMAPRYIANTAVKLRAYLDTGSYRHDLPGLLPLSG